MLLEESACSDQCVLLVKLCWPLPCFILYSKAKLACYSRYLLHSSPCDEKDISFFFGVSSRRPCKSSKNHSTSASSALVVGAQTWIPVILKGLPWKQTDHSVVFEILSKFYSISNSFVDYDGYSISSKGFLPTVVDIMVI